MKLVVRFIVVGGVSTLVDFLVYMIISIKIPVSVSKAISMCVSCIVSFFLNRKWTFEVKSRYSLRESLEYIFVQIINITVNVISNQMIYNLTQQKVIAFMGATFIAMCVNFTLQKFIVFKKSEKSD